MADTFGDSFSPLDQQNPSMGQQRPFGGGATSPVQDAIKILSLRMPRVVGASALGPFGLLNGAGGGAFGGGGSLEELLARLFGNRPTAGPVASMPMWPGGGGAPGQAPSGGGSPPPPSWIFNPPGGATPGGPAPPSMNPPSPLEPRGPGSPGKF